MSYLKRWDFEATQEQKAGGTERTGDSGKKDNHKKTE